MAIWGNVLQIEKIDFKKYEHTSVWCHLYLDHPWHTKKWGEKKIRWMQGIKEVKWV